MSLWKRSSLGNKQSEQNRLHETDPPVETRPAQRAVRVRAPGETRREEDEAHLRSMLDRLTTLEAIAEAREPIDSNGQLQQRILEDMRVLLRDVNNILEDRSQSDRRQDGEQDPFTFNPQQEVNVNPEAVSYTHLTLPTILLV